MGTTAGQDIHGNQLLPLKTRTLLPSVHPVDNLDNLISHKQLAVT